MRQAAYCALFAGAFGHTYGHVNLWRFNVPGKVRTRERFDMMDLYWMDLLDSPGAWQMRYARQLMLSRPQGGRVPDPALLAGNEDGERRQVATSGQGHAFVYTPYGDTIVIREQRIPWTDWRCWWYDVRTGASRRVMDSGRAVSCAFSLRAIRTGEMTGCWWWTSKKREASMRDGNW